MPKQTKKAKQKNCKSHARIQKQKITYRKVEKKGKISQTSYSYCTKRSRLEKKITKELKIMKSMNKRPIDHQIFVDKDGHKKGGVEIETTNPTETQVEKVGGQKRMLPEKKRSAKWY